MTYHDGDVVPVVVGQGTIATEQVLLCPQETVQVIRVVPYDLCHVIQTVVLDECINKQHLCLKVEIGIINSKCMLDNFFVINYYL